MKKKSDSDIAKSDDGFKQTEEYSVKQNITIDYDETEKPDEIIDEMVSEFVTEFNDTDTYDYNDDSFSDVTSDYREPDNLGESLFDYRVYISGTIYQLPMYVTDLIGLGWRPSKYEEIYKEIEPLKTKGFTFTKSGYEMYITVANYDINQKQAIECVVATNIQGICYDEMDKVDIKMLNDIEWGLTKPEDVSRLFGNPDDEYNSDDLTKKKMTYKENTYNYVVFSFKGEEQLYLSGIEIKNYKEPDGFSTSEPDRTYIPKVVFMYKKPSSLTDNPEDFIFELDGSLYWLPCPVQEFVDNGWTIIEKESGDIVDGYDFDYVTIEKNGVKLRTPAYNYYKNGTFIQNCFITSFSLQQYDLRKASMSATVLKKVSFNNIEEEIKSYLQSLQFDYYESEDGFIKRLSREYRYDRVWEIGISEEGVKYISIKNHFSPSTSNNN